LLGLAVFLSLVTRVSFPLWTLSGFALRFLALVTFFLILAAVIFIAVGIVLVGSQRVETLLGLLSRVRMIVLYRVLTAIGAALPPPAKLAAYDTVVVV
jgi:hypothetical protein